LSPDAPTYETITRFPTVDVGQAMGWPVAFPHRETFDMA
jgi:hypothetical protein